MSDTNLTNEETLVEDVAEPVQRKNPFCVISKNGLGEYKVKDIQTNESWGSNPYGESYAIVPDDMVEAIMETRGFVDIELNDEGTEVVSFTALEIPEIPVPEPEPTTEEKLEATNQTVTALEQELVSTQLALTEQYEINIALESRLAELEAAAANA